MALFQSHIDYLHNGKEEDRKQDLIDFIIKYFQPQEWDEFFIMDSHLNVEVSLRNPFKDNNIDEMFWSSLIATIAMKEPKNISFKIITTEKIMLEGYPPFTIQYNEPDTSITIEACHYKDGNNYYQSYILHDRYIIQKNGGTYKGLHIGASIESYLKKDVLITIISANTIIDIIKNYILIWEKSIETKGWKK